MSKINLIAKYANGAGNKISKSAKVNVVTDAIVLGLSLINKNEFQILPCENSPFTKSQLVEVKEEYLVPVGASGEAGSVAKTIYSLNGRKVLLIAVGIGKLESKSYSWQDIEKIRRAAGVAISQIENLSTITFALPSHHAQLITATTQGALLGSYQFNQFKNTTKPKIDKQNIEINILTNLSGKTNNEIVRASEITADATNFARDLINTPPNYLTPNKFVEEISAKIKKDLKSNSSVKIKVWDEKQLKAQGYGGLIGVGQGSINPPRLLHLSYSPPKSKKYIALVGKGITFDSGGLALKGADGMEDMKSDMSGAAAVCATLIAAAKLNLPIKIDAWAALAENMPSDTAQRPSDIIRIYGGNTVEVINPDAEGRLVLADALVKAQEVAKENKKSLDAIIDVATLTYAQGVALGTRVAGAMGNNDSLTNEFLLAAQNTGELFWPMPLPAELRSSLDSPVADIANMGERMGGMLVAGLFLKHFIQEEQPWLHLDIASPALNAATAWGYTPTGGTGFAVRSMLELAKNYSN